MSGRFRGLYWIAYWLLLFVGVLVLVQERALASTDRAVLGFIAATRPLPLVDGFNWLFRLGFAQVDAAIAVIWAAAIYVRRRSLAAALPPLVLFAAIGVQVGLRLVVNQPAPGPAFELPRRFADQPIASALDRPDAIVRNAFVAATTAPGPDSGGRGTFPSGHATRSLFLVLLAVGYARPRRWATLLVVLAALIGYSAMYFGYHWPSDVLGGYLLALAFAIPAGWLRDWTTVSVERVGVTWLPRLS